MTPSLARRVREHRTRALVRAWAFRQRHHAHGVWFRLRRVLADASAAYVISTEDARALLAEGHRLEAVGSELDPPKLIVFVPAARVAGIASSRLVAVRLSVEVLSADCLALVPFDARS